MSFEKVAQILAEWCRFAAIDYRLVSPDLKFAARQAPKNPSHKPPALNALQPHRLDADTGEVQLPAATVDEIAPTTQSPVSIVAQSR